MDERVKGNFFRKKSGGAKSHPGLVRDRFTVIRILPNVVTLIAMMFGLTSMRCAMHGDFPRSIILLGYAAFLDGIDGRLARALGSCSIFGGELDSLADVISFGVCSPMIMYMWGLYDIRLFGWGVTLVFSSSIALRLARFNTLFVFGEKNDFGKVAIAGNFFYGIPAPIAAVLNVFPLLLHVEFGIERESLVVPAVLWSLFLSFMCISNIPTLSLKKLRINNRFIPYLLLLFIIFVVSLIIVPLKTGIFFSALYIATLPFVILYYYLAFKRLKKDNSH